MGTCMAELLYGTAMLLWDSANTLFESGGSWEELPGPYNSHTPAQSAR